ncbi:MAG: aromatic amino acid transport family protein [Gammaproteobacteria bacterium]|nr:aromatic amino acid transport family protein [Gammaproteobacteria bacterium]
MHRKLAGCILMLLGTAVGAGMLALPLATASGNWQMTLIMMIGSWLIMTAGAFALLEVNLWFPAGSNFIRMVGSTIGKSAKWVTWIAYLLLFYSLLCAYLSGTSDILHGLVSSLPRSAATFLALFVLGGVVIRGVSSVDIVNRGLMSIKLIAYLILIAAVFPHISLENISGGTYFYKTSALMVIVTSFGFGSIIPTLRDYLKSDVKQLTWVLLIGSILPMVIYLLWIGATQGLLSRSELTQMAVSSQPNSMLMHGISALLDNPILGSITKLFISICAVTSFLNVSIGLVDFIADGFQTEKKGLEGIKIYVFAFLPPLIIVLLAPGIFIKALSYAGFCCVFLLIFLPMVMLYVGRYRQHQSGQKLLPNSKALILSCAVIAVLLMILQWVNV